MTATTEGRYRTPEYVFAQAGEPIECAECGHLHFFGRPFLGYGVCPVCDCTGQDDAPYLAERVPQDRPKTMCARCRLRVEHTDDGWHHLPTVAGLEADRGHRAAPRGSRW